jgi:urease accessory protein
MPTIERSASTFTDAVLLRAARVLGALATGVAAPLVFVSSASAHHMTGGRVPATLFEGLMSGLAHPVIGLDHLFAVIALGVLASRLPKGALVVATFLLAALAGTGVHVARLDLPAAEIVVSVSVIALGTLLVAQARAAMAVLATFAFVAGIFHGYAYGESIVGAEATPLAAYLFGFTLIQLAVALGAGALARAVAAQPASAARMSRAIGAAAAVCGLFFLAKAIGI